MTTKLFISSSRSAATLRLFCLPHAGAGATAYRRLASQLPSPIDACALELPGRGIRIREQQPTHLGGLARQLATELCPHLDRPFALMGYSMGSLLGFELARELQRLGMPLPQHLFVAAQDAPHHHPDPSTPRPDLSDAELVAALESCYGRSLPSAILAEEDTLAFFVRIIRADLRLLGSYRYYDAPPLGCPITVFAGGEDRSVSIRGLADWQRHTRRGCEVLTFERRGHFFLDEEARALASAMAERLSLLGCREALREPPAGT